MKIDYVLKKDKNYYPQVYLKNFKCIGKKVIRHFIDDLENSFDNSDEPGED